MFATLNQMQRLARAYEQNYITSQELMHEWDIFLHLLYLRWLQTACLMMRKQWEARYEYNHHHRQPQGRRG